MDYPYKKLAKSETYLIVSYKINKLGALKKY